MKIENRDEALGFFSNNELKAELKRREDLERLAAIPKPIENPNFSELVTQCNTYITELSESIFPIESGDHIQYIFEEAMKAVYGKNVFEWINEKLM